MAEAEIIEQGKRQENAGTGNEIDVKQALKVIINSLKKQGDISFTELQDMYYGKKEKYVPVSVFATKLSPGEALCKFMKENLGMKLVEIAEMLGRDQRGIWTNYNNALKKMPDKLDVGVEDVAIPLSVFADRKRSIYEHIIVYLSEKYRFTNYKIAKLLNRKPGSVYTAYKKAKK